VLPEDASARIGYDIVQDKFGEGAPGTLQIVMDIAEADAAADILADDGIAGAMPPMPAADDSGHVMVQAVPTVDRPTPLWPRPWTGSAPTFRPAVLSGRAWSLPMC
jgi:RND superfamily putative drug exporter